jgi:hypothetical protein
LTIADELGTLVGMPTPMPRLDPERRRRRLRLLAEYADATAQRARLRPQRLSVERIRELVDNRRRLAG